MLIELSIRNFAIIDELTIAFRDGLSIITGETGAGKSIIIGAMGLLLGDRANADMIRSGADCATVDALFNIRDKKDLRKLLFEKGFPIGDELIIRRVISRSGKNRIYIDGSLATTALLTEIAESLLSICGQHEHQVILQAQNHLDILDTYSGLLELRNDYTRQYHDFDSLRIRLADLENLRSQQREKEELFRFQIQEIDEAGLVEGEDETLIEEKRILTNIQKLMDWGEAAYEILYGRQGSVLESMKNANLHIQEIKKVDSRFPLDGPFLDSLYYQIEDASLALRNYLKDLSFDPARLEVVEERLLLIGKLKRKYGPNLSDVLARQKVLHHELQQMITVDDQIEDVCKSLADLRGKLVEKVSELTVRRVGGAARLKESIEKEIHALNMPRAEFKAVITTHDSEGNEAFHEKGQDDVEFFLSANIGEDLKPLKRIASGGELSRIVLALKKVLAGTWSVGTIVFDEVDSGIGGATAEIVGQKLKDVSQYHQVICITHLPQIACFAEAHYHVVKGITGERTRTAITLLSSKKQLDEISRMLAGTAITSKTVEHAREMLENAKGKSRIDSSR